MDRRTLFLRTLTDLDQKSVGTDEYVATRAAGLLRQLLMDEQPLVHQVNRDSRIKLRFEVADHSRRYAVFLEDNPVVFLVMDGVFPATSPPGYIVRNLNLDDWLGYRAGAYHGETFSVKDVVRHLAHVAGGVHAGPAKTPMDEGLAAIASLISVNGMSGVARTVKGISRVTVAGLEPLRQAIEQQEPMDQNGTPPT